MGRKNKLWRFQQLTTFSNVFENFFEEEEGLVTHLGEKVATKGLWNRKVFDNEHPVVLELACGKGEYTTGMAEKEPQKNFIGVDIKGARIWKGAKKALENKMINVAFLRTRIELLDQFVGENEVSEIWITFPDPFLKASKESRRLTYKRFLDMYKVLLVKDGLVHLKTDSPELFEFTKGSLAEYGIEPLVVNADIYSGELPDPRLEIKTYYEKKHLADGRKIKYVQFKF